MCGRYVLRASPKVVAAAFGLSELPLWEPRYNIAPTQSIPAVRVDADGGRRLAHLRWGLVPGWAADPGIGNRMINARSETVETKPAFRAAFRGRRCLLPADGFYEWKKEGARKQPFHIRRRDEAPFAFAGLWEYWERDGEIIESGTILTTEANGTMRPLHERMPVILDPADYAAWLDPANRDVQGLKALLRPCGDDVLTASAVGALVNNPRHDDPRCLEPVGQ